MNMYCDIYTHNSIKVTEVEINWSVVQNIMEMHPFRSTTEYIILQNYGTNIKIVYAPSYWMIEDGGLNSNKDFFYSKIFNYSGIIDFSNQNKFISFSPGIIKSDYLALLSSK